MYDKGDVAYRFDDMRSRVGGHASRDRRVVREAAKAGLNIEHRELQRNIERAREYRAKDNFAKAQSRATREPA